MGKQQMWQEPSEVSGNTFRELDATVPAPAPTMELDGKRI